MNINGKGLKHREGFQECEMPPHKDQNKSKVMAQIPMSTYLSVTKVLPNSSQKLES